MASDEPGERQRAPVPRVGVLERVGAGLLRRLGVDETDELLLWLGLGDQRDADRHHDVHDERRGGRHEGGALAAERDDTQAQRAERVLAEEARRARPTRCPPTSPIQPAVGVIRFQNMPRMKVANSGALKNPNSVWR